MRVASFVFKKIHIEKLSDNFEKLNITSNIEILDIIPLKQELFNTKDEFLGIKFSFKLNYEPSIANIEFGGDIILSVDSKLAKDLMKEWKDKKVPEDFKIEVYNIILRRAHIRALQLEDELNLPVHVVLPVLKSQNESQEKK